MQIKQRKTIQFFFFLLAYLLCFFLVIMNNNKSGQVEFFRDLYLISANHSIQIQKFKRQEALDDLRERLSRSSILDTAQSALDMLINNYDQAYYIFNAEIEKENISTSKKIKIIQNFVKTIRTQFITMHCDRFLMQAQILAFLGEILNSFKSFEITYELAMTYEKITYLSGNLALLQEVYTQTLILTRLSLDYDCSNQSLFVEKICNILGNLIGSDPVFKQAFFHDFSQNFLYLIKFAFLNNSSIAYSCLFLIRSLVKGSYEWQCGNQITISPISLFFQQSELSKLTRHIFCHFSKDTKIISELLWALAFYSNTPLFELSEVNELTQLIIDSIVKNTIEFKDESIVLPSLSIFACISSLISFSALLMKDNFLGYLEGVVIKIGTSHLYREFFVILGNLVIQYSNLCEEILHHNALQKSLAACTMNSSILSICKDEIKIILFNMKNAYNGRFMEEVNQKFLFLQSFLTLFQSNKYVQQKLYKKLNNFNKVCNIVTFYPPLGYGQAERASNQPTNKIKKHFFLFYETLQSFINYFKLYHQYFSKQRQIDFRFYFLDQPFAIYNAFSGGRLILLSLFSSSLSGLNQLP